VFGGQKTEESVEVSKRLEGIPERDGKMKVVGEMKYGGLEVGGERKQSKPSSAPKKSEDGISRQSTGTTLANSNNRTLSPTFTHGRSGEDREKIKESCVWGCVKQKRKTQNAALIRRQHQHLATMAQVGGRWGRSGHSLAASLDPS